MVQTTLSIQMAHLIAHLLIAGNLLALIVGVLMLVIGYFSPLPPRQKKETPT